MSHKKHAGGTPSKYSDEEVMAAYEAQGSREAARQLGMVDISGRVRRIKERRAQADLLQDSGTREEKHRYRGGNSIQELYDNHAVVPDNVIMTGARIAEHGV